MKSIRLFAAVVAVFAVFGPVPTLADIYRWDNGQVIPGTEGIVPAPGVQLDHRELQYATLNNVNLSDAGFDSSDLSFAYGTYSEFTNASFVDTNLTRATLYYSWFTNANLTNANLTDADLTRTPFANATLTGANLTRARMERSDLTNADLTGALLTDVIFEGSLLGANLSNAVISGAYIHSDTFTKEQLFSTASYQSAQLQGIRLDYGDFSGADFRGHDLSRAQLLGVTLNDADFTDANLSDASIIAIDYQGIKFDHAIITGTALPTATQRGFTKEQLYSTASYEQKNLARLGLAETELSFWDLHEQDLTGADTRFSSLVNSNLRRANLLNASMAHANFTNADLREANLTGADLSYGKFTGVNIEGATIARATLSPIAQADGFTREHLYATASYQVRDLSEVVLEECDLTGWSFRDLDLSGARFSKSNLTGADFTGAVINGADFSWNSVGGLSRQHLYSTASYNARNLSGIVLYNNDHSGWDFSGQDLTNAELIHSVFDNCNLDFADLRGARGISSMVGATHRNMIGFGGEVNGVRILDGEVFLVRNYHGNPVHYPAPIWINVRDELSVSAMGKVELLFDANLWDSLITFVPGIPVQLGGTLNLAFAADVDILSQVGRTFQAFDWTGVTPTGTFSVASNYPWDVSELYTTGEVTLLLPGDANGDQTVDLNDLNLVRNNFGAAGPGDTNADGIVDLIDLNNVRNFFGASSPQAVPEPTSLAITIIAIASLLPIAKRKLSPQRAESVSARS